VIANPRAQIDGLQTHPTALLGQPLLDRRQHALAQHIPFGLKSAQRARSKQRLNVPGGWRGGGREHKGLKGLERSAFAPGLHRDDPRGACIEQPIGRGLKPSRIRRRGGS